MQIGATLVLLCFLGSSTLATFSNNSYRGINNIPDIIKDAIAAGNNGNPYMHSFIEGLKVIQVKPSWLAKLAESIIALIDRLGRCEDAVTLRNTKVQAEQCGTQHLLDECLANITALQQQHEGVIMQKNEQILKLQANLTECGDRVNGDRINEGTIVLAKDGFVPFGAIESGGGPKIAPYYVARTNVDGNLLPCKLTPVHRTCWVAWNKTEIKYNEYQVLVNVSTSWLATTSVQPIPSRAIAFGYIKTNNTEETLYVGRAPIGNIIVPGYVFSSNRTLLHSSAYKNQIKNDYEILVRI